MNLTQCTGESSGKDTNLPTQPIQTLLNAFETTGDHPESHLFVEAVFPGAFPWTPHTCFQLMIG